jgi:hypothetical protein
MHSSNHLVDDAKDKLRRSDDNEDNSYHSLESEVDSAGEDGAQNEDSFFLGGAFGIKIQKEDKP